MLAHLAKSKKHFLLDFEKMLLLLEDEVKMRVGPGISRGELYLYMELIEGTPQQSMDPEVVKLRQLVHSREKFAERAVMAGFKSEGILRRQYKPWMPESIKRKEYQEKKADTSLVARVVEQGIRRQNQVVHIVVSGDSDMLPAVEMVIPGYSKHVIWVMNDPTSYAPELAQSSSTVSAGYGCVYLDRNVARLKHDP